MDETFRKYSKLLNQTEEHFSFETLATYANLKGQLSQKEKNFIELHLKSCSICKEKLENIIEEDSEIDTGQAKKPLIFQIPTFIRYAAAACIIIGAGIIFYLFSSIGNEEITLTENVPQKEIRIEKVIGDTLQVAEKEEKKIERLIKQELGKDDKELFAVNIVLESFIERNLRSENKLVIVSPMIDENVINPVKFEWRRNNFAGPVELDLVDNKNRKIISEQLEGDSFLLQNELTKGLYYWKIKKNGKVEKVGKFIIL